MAQQESKGGSGVADRLKSEARGLVGALGSRALGSVRGRLDDATGRLTQYVEGGGGPGVMAAVTGAKSAAEGQSPKRGMLRAGMSFAKEKVTGMFRRGGGGRGGKKLKLTNIVESIDVGVPVKVAYNQWTQYSDFPKFTKKVDNAERNKGEETKVNWKAQVWWSHRSWEATIQDQVPDDHIVWRSKGQKGHVDGAVTFHELAPNLTRVLLVMEYHPQGLFERTGNLWRAQGRRARLEFKHFRRHIMTEGILHPDDLEGWRGTIHDGEVVESHEDAMEREQKESGNEGNGRRRRQDSDSDQDMAAEQQGEQQDEQDDQEEERRSEDSGDRWRTTEAQTEEEAPRRASRSRRTASGRRTSEGTGTRGSTTQGNGRRRTGTAAQRGGGSR
jgi:hypothetical protein